MKVRRLLCRIVAVGMILGNCLTAYATQYPQVDFAYPTLQGIEVKFESGDRYLLDYTGNGKRGLYFKEETDENGFAYIELYPGANEINKEIVAAYLQAHPDSELGKAAKSGDAANIYFVSSRKKLKKDKEVINAAWGRVTYEERSCTVYLIAGERYAKGKMYAKAALEALLDQ